MIKFTHVIMPAASTGSARAGEGGDPHIVASGSPDAALTRPRSIDRFKATRCGFAFTT